MSKSVKIGSAHYENNVQGELMLYSHDPVPDSWYVNETGKVLKARLLLYRSGRLNAVIIENLEGQRNIIKLENWYKLNLSRYCCAARNFIR